MGNSSKLTNVVLKAVNTPVKSAKMAYFSSGVCYCFAIGVKKFAVLYVLYVNQNKNHRLFLRFLSKALETFAIKLDKMGASMEGKGS